MRAQPLILIHDVAVYAYLAAGHDAADLAQHTIRVAFYCNSTARGIARGVQATGPGLQHTEAIRVLRVFR